MDKERIKRTKETYDVKGYDFTLGCVLNHFYDYDLAECVREKLSGSVDFLDMQSKRVIAELKHKAGSANIWTGTVKGAPDSRVTISYVEGYHFRISLNYTPGDLQKIDPIRKALGEIPIGKKKRLVDFLLTERKKPSERKTPKPEVTRRKPNITERFEPFPYPPNAWSL